MEWTEIPYVWQECFKEAWKSFQEGSRPIGALIADEQGEILARGKSAAFNELTDCVVTNNELAHAEINALLKLDNRLYPKRNTFVLYSTMEPCPLCFGAFYMSGLRKLEYAANDNFAGSANLKGATPYLSRKPIQINGPVSYLENLSIVLNLYFDTVTQYEKSHPVRTLMAAAYVSAAQLAAQWAQEKKLKNPEHLQIEEIYQMVQEELNFSL